MRITIIGPIYPYRGGIAQHSAMLVRALIKNGHNVQVISYKRQYPSWLYPGKSDKDPSLVPLLTPAEFLLDPIWVNTWYWTAQRIRDTNPDLVVIQWWTTFWSIPYTILSSLLKKYQIPVVFLIHNVLPHEQHFWDPLLARMALQTAVADIVHSVKEKERLQHMLPDAIVDICDLPTFDYLTEKKVSKKEARDHLNLPRDKFIFLFFGIVRTYKGLPDAITAMHGLVENGLSPYLVIAGEFWYQKEKVINQIREYGIDDNVFIDDRYIPDEEAALYFSAADAVIAPYLSATQSAVACMAVGFGVPLIISDVAAAGFNKANQNRIAIFPAGDNLALQHWMGEFLHTQVPEQPMDSPPADDWNLLVDKLVQIMTLAKK